MLSLDLAINAVVVGLLLGGFYAAVTIGVTISFGMLGIVNIAHPAFIMLGSFVAYIVNSNFGIDPILIAVVMAPVFFLLGMAAYQIYFYPFEQRGEESIQGLAFFFGLLFVGEVALILIFGVDYRFVEAPYRSEPAFRLCRLAIAHADPVPGLAGDARRAAALSRPHFYRPRHSGGIAGPAGIAADGGEPEPGQADRPLRFIRAGTHPIAACAGRAALVRLEFTGTTNRIRD